MCYIFLLAACALFQFRIMLSTGHFRGIVLCVLISVPILFLNIGQPIVSLNILADFHFRLSIIELYKITILR